VRLVLSRTTAKAKVAQPERIAGYRRIRRPPFDFLPDRRAKYEIELRIVRFRIGEGFANVVTNLPEGAFTAADVREIYRLRWGVETSLRKLKLNIGAADLHSRRVVLVAQEIYARMALYDFYASIARYASALPRVASTRKHLSCRGVRP